MAHQVFICHSARDKQIADAACATLEAQRVRCWIAPRDVLAGDEWGKSIIDALGSCSIVILVFSAHANESPQVRREIERAVSKSKIIVPFRIEDVLPSNAMEYALGNTHWLDAITPPMEQRLAELSRTVSVLLERSPGADPATRVPVTATAAAAVAAPGAAAVTAPVVVAPIAAVAAAPVPTGGGKTGSGKTGGGKTGGGKTGGMRGPLVWVAAAVLALLIGGGITAATLSLRHSDAATSPTTPAIVGVEPTLNAAPNGKPTATGHVAVSTLRPVPPLKGHEANGITDRPRPANKEPATSISNPNKETVTHVDLSAPVQPHITAQQQDALDQVEMKLDQMSSRAVAINGSLQTLQAEMQSGGNNMRGDVVAHRASMNSSLAKAKQALAAHDSDRAGRYADQAQADISALQTFLGR